MAEIQKEPVELDPEVLENQKIESELLGDDDQKGAKPDKIPKESKAPPPIPLRKWEEPSTHSGYPVLPPLFGPHRAIANVPDRFVNFGKKPLDYYHYDKNGFKLYQNNKSQIYRKISDPVEAMETEEDHSTVFHTPTEGPSSPPEETRAKRKRIEDDVESHLTEMTNTAFRLTKKEASKEATELLKTRDLTATQAVINMWKSNLFSRDIYRTTRLIEEFSNFIINPLFPKCEFYFKQKTSLRYK